MKDINTHAHWQFGNFSPNKENRFVYEIGGAGNKPPDAAEIQKLQEAVKEVQSLQEVRDQANT